jgi:hypothetical protein
MKTAKDIDDEETSMNSEYADYGLPAEIIEVVQSEEALLKSRLEHAHLTLETDETIRAFQRVMLALFDVIVAEEVGHAHWLRPHIVRRAQEESDTVFTNVMARHAGLVAVVTFPANV